MDGRRERNPSFRRQPIVPELLQPPPSPHHSSPSIAGSFPILALTILGILTTSILLLTYYIFVIRCCLNWNRSDVTGLVAGSRRRRLASEVPTAIHVPSIEPHGLDEPTIQALPAFRYRKISEMHGIKKSSCASFRECAVCLSEFQDEEKIRLLPNCFHVFHIDCIDTWLQANANCPLCRAAISSSCQIPLEQLLGPDELVIQEVSNTEESRQHEVNTVANSNADANPGASKTEEEISNKKRTNSCHLTSKGDECIDVMRARDIPMRRSFSMGSLGDGQQLFLAVQNILQQNPHFHGDDSSSSSSSSGRLRRPFFSFKQHRGRAVLPI